MGLQVLENSGESRMPAHEIRVDLELLEANTWTLLQGILPWLHHPNVTQHLFMYTTEVCNTYWCSHRSLIRQRDLVRKVQSIMSVPQTQILIPHRYANRLLSHEATGGKYQCWSENIVSGRFTNFKFDYRMELKRWAFTIFNFSVRGLVRPLSYHSLILDVPFETISVKFSLFKSPAHHSLAHMQGMSTL